MKDIASKCELPKKTSICCWNDTEPFNTEPLGLPIKYYPSVVISNPVNIQVHKYCLKMRELDINKK